jgi:eukaryotic-like serine/threonine-protein kinase
VSAASPAQDLVGAVLNGRWRLVKLLGEGGMGAVFEADGPPGVGKRAIKLLHQEFIREEQILSRFFTESQATRTLNHPNVAQVLETATAENGTPYLVMELLKGVPVSTYVDAGQALPPAQAVHIAHGVLQALGAAHARNIIHRDIKPDNLFLVHDTNGSFLAKVLDFGIAKVMDVAGGMGQKTRTGVLLGTPGYMSPEQIKDSKGVDARTDLWSVGIIFYELLAGSSPFPADNEFARLTSVLTEEIRPIEQVAPHLASWSGFFHRALAKDPALRFQTAEEMSAGLVATMRSQSMYPPQPAPQERRPSLPPGANGSHAATTAMSAMVESPSSAGIAPPRPDARREPSGLMRSPALAGPVQPYSGLMQSPMSQGVPSMPYATVAAVSQGSIPPPRSGTLASTPPPPPLSSNVVGEASNVGPTHLSAQHPGGAPVMHGYPPIEVVSAPPRRAAGAAWWLVGVVAFVAFGLGFALGFLVG